MVPAAVVTATADELDLIDVTLVTATADLLEADEDKPGIV